MTKAVGRLPENSMITALAAAGGGHSVFAGYVGKTAENGTVRLHMSLRDHSQYLEFPESAILHAVPARSDYEHTVVWLKADAEVRAVVHRVVQASARSIEAAIARNARNIRNQRQTRAAGRG